MAIKVIKVGEVCGTNVVPHGNKAGEFASILTNLKSARQPAHECRWQIAINIGKGAAAREVMIDLEPFISSLDYIKSKNEPVFFSGKTNSGSQTLVFFRGRFFL